MGTNMPSYRGPAINWILARMNLWSTNAAQIGLDESEVTALNTLAGTASSARSAAATARTESKNATRNWHDKADEAMDEARELILKIKAFAATTGDPQVWVLSGLSPKEPPGQTPAPDVPSDINAQLLDQGFIRLSWKGKGPAGTRYDVTRMLPGEASFTVIGDTNKKRLTDDTIPAGTSQAMYRVIARQTDFAVGSTILTVRFGNANQDQMIGQAPDLKLPGQRA